MKQTLLLPLLAIILLSSPLAHAEQPQTRIETYPQWTSGTLSIYILDFPQNEATYTSNTIKIRIAVWGATPENPVQIQLNGETTATIENPGMYTYEWSLRGSHHLLIRCPNKIFQQAAFNIKAPPPPPPVIQLDEFTSKLEQQRTTILTTMLAATIAGIPAGIWIKRKTKITTTWATLPMGAVTILGIRYLPTLYMLIPLGLSATLVYLLAREYADYIAISTVTEGSIETDVLPLDDEGNAITNIGPIPHQLPLQRHPTQMHNRRRNRQHHGNTRHHQDNLQPHPSPQPSRINSHRRPRRQTSRRKISPSIHGTSHTQPSKPNYPRNGTNHRRKPPRPSRHHT